MKLALALTAGTAAAFVAPSSAPAAKTQLAAAPVQEWAGATAPFGFFDPLGLSKIASEETLAWYRAAELKHSRVAMLACWGMITADGWHPLFGGKNSANPLLALTQTPKLGWLLCAFLLLFGNRCLCFH